MNKFDALLYKAQTFHNCDVDPALTFWVSF